MSQALIQIPQFKEEMISRVSERLGSDEKAKKILAVVGVEMAMNPKLRECDRLSLITSVMSVVDLDLSPSKQMGHAYMIPRYSKKLRGLECTVIVGYKGLLELARRSGDIARISANVVYQQEVLDGSFSATLEPPMISHSWRYDIERDPRDIVAAYAVAELKDGSLAPEILTRREIEKRRSRSGSNGNYSPWETDFEAMAKKSALRALLNSGRVPMSIETQASIAAAYERDADHDALYPPQKIYDQSIIPEIHEEAEIAVDVVDNNEVVSGSRISDALTRDL